MRKQVKLVYETDCVCTATDERSITTGRNRTSALKEGSSIKERRFLAAVSPNRLMGLYTEVSGGIHNSAKVELSIPVTEISSGTACRNEEAGKTCL